MCMCLAQGGVGRERGECMRGLGLGFTNPVGTGGVLDVCLYMDCGREFETGSRRVGWCYVCLSFWMLCVDCRSRYLYIVLGGHNLHSSL